MNIYYNLPKNSKLTEEQREEIRRAASMPIVYDEDSPETTPDMLEKFERVALAKKGEDLESERQKQHPKAHHIIKK